MNEQETIVNPEIVQTALSDAKLLARDQISAAWQLQVEKVQEAMATGWRQHVERVLDERFDELGHTLAPSLTAAIIGREIDAQRTLAAREEEIQALRTERDKLQGELTEREAAWHGERHQIEASWTQKLSERDTAFEERLRQETDLTAERVRASVEEVAQNALHEAALVARRNGSRETAGQLNQVVRRLHAAENGETWREALLDGAALEAGRCAYLAITGERVRVEAQRGFDGGIGLDLALAESTAISTAVVTKDTVVSVRSSSEFGERFTDLAPGSKGAKAYLFPVRTRNEVIGILYAEPEEESLEASTLELLATVAGLANAVRTTPPPVPVAAPAKTSTPLVSTGSGEGLATLMNSLSREEQDLHLRAQRFARVQVAEMRLYKSNLVKEGRNRHNIYSSLRDEIDLSREAFRTQFMSAGPSMVDYFHLELVHTLANDDPALLGEEYPGPLSIA